MIIGTKELLELVEKERLVENLSERELKEPEGAGFDLRADEIYRIKDGYGFLGVTERHTPETELVAKYGVHKDFTIKPGEYYIIQTMEKVNLLDNIAIVIRPRSTLQRCGIAFYSAPIHPGYKGQMSFGVYNAGKRDFKIELGARFAHSTFFKTGENVRSYEGQWQGGRVSTEGKVEKQN